MQFIYLECFQKNESITLLQTAHTKINIRVLTRIGTRINIKIIINEHVSYSELTDIQF